MSGELDPERSTSSDGPMRKLIERTDRVRNQARDLASEVEGGLGDLEAALRAETEAHPYATLGTALGVGWIFGRVLPSWRTTGAIMLFGSRLLLIALAQRVATQKGATS